MQHTYAPGDKGYEDKLELGELPVEDVLVVFDPSLMAATHNYSCPICRDDKAVLSMGIMQPCRKCQGDGWNLIKVDSRPCWKRLLNIKHQGMKNENA